ncbi:MAG: hypothetical protein HC830_01825 [Bacteroidetes bacterium]|nr:hypothetical protein [Bacteroidota bacterium]
MNGKVINLTGGTTSARDLLIVIDNIPLIKNWLREHKVRFCLKNTFELILEKIPD